MKRCHWGFERRRIPRAARSDHSMVAAGKAAFHIIQRFRSCTFAVWLTVTAVVRLFASLHSDNSDICIAMLLGARGPCPPACPHRAVLRRQHALRTGPQQRLTHGTRLTHMTHTAARLPTARYGSLLCEAAKRPKAKKKASQKPKPKATVKDKPQAPDAAPPQSGTSTKERSEQRHAEEEQAQEQQQNQQHEQQREQQQDQQQQNGQPQQASDLLLLSHFAAVVPIVCIVLLSHGLLCSNCTFTAKRLIGRA